MFPAYCWESWRNLVSILIKCRVDVTGLKCVRGALWSSLVEPRPPIWCTCIFPGGASEMTSVVACEVLLLSFRPLVSPTVF